MELVAPPKAPRLQAEILQQLAQQLQDRLLALPGGVPYQVQCVSKSNKLLVLVQHPPTELLDAQPILAELQQVLAALAADRGQEFHNLDLPCDAEAILYLRQLGQKRPYTFRHLNLANRDQPIKPVGEAQVDLTQPLSEAPAAPSQSENSLGQDSLLAEEAVDADQPPGDWEEGLVLRSEQVDGNSAPDAIDADDQALVQERERSPWLLWIIAGVGVSVVSFVAGALLITRPCIVGRCEPLQMAESLSQQADQTLKTAQSNQNLEQAEQQLNRAVGLLQDIPAFAKQHQEATELLEKNQTQINLLAQVRAAESKAEAANQKSHNLPQPIAAWQEVQALWKQAIAQLEAIPQTSPLASFAQQRLKIYRENLATASQYIVTEQQAQKKLAAAKATARLAETRQSTAATQENLNQAQVTWQVAVNALKSIPNTATPSAEAQQLLAEYSTKLDAARDRANREALAQKSLAQAGNLGQKASSLQQQNQWSQATINWRSAVAQLEQIPQGTAYSARAQSLLPSYREALAKAETQLKTVLAQQKLRDDLNRVCAGSPKTCVYVILGDRIRVQFTPAYEQALRQTYTSGQAGNYSMLGGAVNHINSLQTALQNVSNNAGLPLEVYNSTGSDMVGSFNPGH